MQQATETDHDVLIRVETKLDLLTRSFEEVRLSNAGKASDTRVDKLQSDIDSLKHKVYMGLGALAALQLFAKVVLQNLNIKW